VGVVGEAAVAVAVAVGGVAAEAVGTKVVGARHGLRPRASQSAPGLALPEGEVFGDGF
jgi:hypothetical protein